MRSPRAALGASSRVSGDVVLARSLGYLQLAGAVMAVGFGLLVPSRGVDRTGMLIAALVGIALAAVLVRAQPSGHRLWLPLAGILSTAVISLYVFFGGESATPFALFYAVAAGATVWCRSGTETVLQVAWMVLSYSLAVWITPEADQAAWPAVDSADIAGMVTLAAALSALTALVWQFKLRYVEGDRRTAAVVEFSRDAIAGVDLDGRITTWNHGAEELYGYDSREILGRHVSILSPPGRRDEQNEALERMRAGESLRDRRTERIGKDGSTRIVSASLSPVTDSDGNVIGGAGLHHDITAEVLAADRLALHAAMLDEVDGAVVVTEAGGEISFWSKGGERLLGYTAEEVTGRSLHDLLTPAERTRIALMREAREQTGALEGEIDAVDSSGNTVPIYFRSRHVCHRPGLSDQLRSITVAVDISARRAAERAAERHTQAQYEIAELGRLALGGEPCEVLFARAVEVTSRVLVADHAVMLERRAGVDDLLIVARGGEVSEQVGTAARGTESLLTEETLRGSEPIVVEDWQGDERFRQEDGHLPARSGSGAAVLVGDASSPFGVLLVTYSAPRAVTPDCIPFLQAIANVLSDALRSREARREIRRQGLHDSVTGLPNRGLLIDRVERALERAEGDRALAVLLLDVDHFKVINDSLGHASGDEVLRALAGRLQDAIRPGDTLARLTAGEFAVLCEQLPSAEVAGQIADSMLAATREPIPIADSDHTLRASIGIAMGRPGSTAGDLLRDADSALSYAKSQGRGRYEVFNVQMRARILDRVRVESALRDALRADDQIHTDYQPLVSLRTGGIIGAEALARWTHPSWGPVPPASFIPVAEETGYIHELGRLVMFRALRESAGWRGLGEFRGVAVNVSPVQLSEVSALAREALDAAHVPPGFLRIEITEGVLIEELEQAGETLSSLIELGIGLSLDDFGTGYSSLSYLGELPFESVKIDRSLIRDIVGNPRASSLASAIIEMGHALDKIVIAEGIETIDQAVLLRKLGCDVGQGFYFARAMSADAFGDLLAKSPRYTLSPLVARAEGHKRRRRPGPPSAIRPAEPDAAKLP